jgi:D-methionine transport system substrate-binding protein
MSRRLISRRSLAALGLGLALVTPAFAQERPLKVGVTAGPHAEIMEIVKQVAERDGLKLQIVEFSDYIQPNAALAQGDLDVNSYQHQPFLDQQVKDRGYKIVSVGKTVVFPMGIYSKRVKSLADLPSGAKVAIPNDPTNGGRALLLLAREGVIKLKPTAGITASPLDIAENPKKLRILELDAAQLPRSLDDTDASAVNTNYALGAGLSPTRDAIAIEDAQSPYMNVIAVQAKDRDRPQVKQLVAAYQSAEVKQFIEAKFQQAIVAGW